MIVLVDLPAECARILYFFLITYWQAYLLGYTRFEGLCTRTHLKIRLVVYFVNFLKNLALEKISKYRWISINYKIQPNSQTLRPQKRLDVINIKKSKDKRYSLSTNQTKKGLLFCNLQNSQCKSSVAAVRKKMAPKRICLIGAGPSGMSVLYQLERLRKEGVAGPLEVSGF